MPEDFFPLKPVSVDFTLDSGGAIYKGSCWKVFLDVMEHDCSSNEDNRFDLTGYEGVCQIRHYSGDSVVIAEPVVTVEENRITIELDDSVTAELPSTGKNYYEVSTYPYDLFLNKDGDNYKVLQGFVDVSPSITEVEV